MQVDELRWLLAVVEDPNLTRVAERLHISQPALSRAIRRLETTVGAELFDRSGRTLAPNARAVALAEQVQRGLSSLDRGIEAVRDSVDPERGEVRLAFMHTLGTWLVPSLVGAYRLEHPRVRFQLHQAAATVMVAELIDGHHDLLLVSPRPTDARLGWEPLFDEPLRLAVPPSHALAERSRVALSEVAHEPFIGVDPRLGLRSTIDAMCLRAGFTPQIAFEGEDVATVRGFVAAGLGVAVVPGRPDIAMTPGDLALTDAGASRTIGLCWHRGRSETAPVRGFAACVRARG